MTAVVRAARPGDGDAFARGFAEVAAEGRWVAREPPVDEPAMSALVDGRTAHDRWFAVVEDPHGTHLGGGVLVPEGRGVVSLGMHLVAAARGRRLGGALLDALLTEARTRGCHRVELGVFADNTAAVRLYASRGFVVEGLQQQRYLRRDGSRRDALLMALLLEPAD